MKTKSIPLLTALLATLIGARVVAQVGPDVFYFEIDGDYGSALIPQSAPHADHFPAFGVADGGYETFAAKAGVWSADPNQPACTSWYHISSQTYMGAQAYRVEAIYPRGGATKRRSEQKLLNDWYTGTDSARYFTLAFRFRIIAPGGAPSAPKGYIAQWHHGWNAPPPIKLQWTYKNGSYFLDAGVRWDSYGDSFPDLYWELFPSLPASPGVWYRMLFRVDPGQGGGRLGCTNCPGGDGTVSAWIMNAQTGEWARLNEQEFKGQIGYHYNWDGNGDRIGDRSGEDLVYEWKVGHYENETDWIILDYDNVAYGKRWNNITKNRLIGYHKSVLNLKFDEGTGTLANDDCWSWNGGSPGDATMDYDNDGSLVGSVARSNDGVGFWRRSLSFSGGYVNVPLDTTDFDFGNYVTVSAWFKTTNAAGTQGLLSIDSDDGVGKLFLDRSDAGLSFGVRHPDGTYSEVNYSHAPGLYADGRWHHLVGTFNRFTDDNRRVKLYVDGVRVLQREGYDKSILRGDTRLVVGRLGSSGSFIGNIDEVNVLNYTMTDADVAALMAQSTAAATRTWDGGSPSTGTWTADSNWQGNVQPASGDFLIFPAGAARLTHTNTFGGGTVFGGIVFQGDNYNIYGNAVTTDQITAEAGATGNTFRPDIQLGAPGYFRAQGSGLQLTFPGDIDLNGHDLILVCQPGQLVCGGVISGTGDVFKSGSGSAAFSGISGNTYNGTTYVVDGFLNLSKYLLVNPGAVRLGRIAVPGNLVIGTILSPLISDAVVCNANNQIAPNAQVTLNPTGELNLNNYNNTISILDMAGGHVTSGAGTLTVTSNILVQADADGSVISGNLSLGPNGNSVILGRDARLTISAVTSGAASVPLLVSGGGELRLTANNTYAGPTTISSSGRLLINGTQPNSAVTLNGGTLGGIGTIGPLTGNIGTVSPGTSAGRLTVNGNATLGFLSTFFVELNGVAVGTGYDQLSVNGVVNLAGSTLAGTVGFAPAPGNAFTIIANDGIDAVQGTFAGLPQGTVFLLGGVTFRISYTGGTGNDVVLTRVVGPSILGGPTRLANGQFRFQGMGEPGLTYIIQAHTNLNTADWLILGSAPADGAGLFQFLDTNAPLFPQRFYRALSP